MRTTHRCYRQIKRKNVISFFNRYFIDDLFAASGMSISIGRPVGDTELSVASEQNRENNVGPDEQTQTDRGRRRRAHKRFGPAKRKTDQIPVEQS